MPSSKTTNLDLNVGYAETDRTQSWINGIDDNFRSLDNSLGTIFKAIENAGIVLSRNVALEDEWSTGAYTINTSFLTAFKNGVATRFGSYIYIFIGNENSTGEIYKFNAVKYTLTKLEAELPLGFNNFKAEQYQGKVFLLGGCVGQVASNLFYIFDIATEEIEVPDGTLTTTVSNCGSCLIDGYIYLFGGLDENNNKLNTILKFNARDYSNSLLATTIPMSIAELTACSKDNVAYIFGGNSSNKIYKFNSLDNTISAITAELPDYVYANKSILLNNNMYILGGKTNSELLNIIYKFNLENETLTSLTFTLPTAVANFAIAITDSYGYLFGGEISTGSSNRIIRFVS